MSDAVGCIWTSFVMVPWNHLSAWCYLSSLNHLPAVGKILQTAYLAWSQAPLFIPMHRRNWRMLNSMTLSFCINFSPLVKVCRNDPGRLKLLRLTTTQPWCSGSQQTPSLHVATPWNERQKVSNDVWQTIKIQSFGGFNTAFLLCVPVFCIATQGKVKSNWRFWA